MDTGHVLWGQMTRKVTRKATYLHEYMTENVKLDTIRYGESSPTVAVYIFLFWASTEKLAQISAPFP
jgi:hypothetical protein